MPKNVLILRATSIHPDPRVEKIGRALLRAGHSVMALGWNRGGDLPEMDTSSGFPICRLCVPARPQAGLRNAPALARWQASVFNWLRIHRSEYDVIHACDFDAVGPALWARRLWGKKVVYDIFDFYTDMLRATPRPVKFALHALDMSAIAEADAVILADEARRAQIAGSHPRRLAVVCNSPEDCLAELQVRPRADRDPAVSLRLVYAGLMQVERGLLPLLEALSAHPEWTLDLAGEGAERTLIVERAQALPNITYHGILSHSAVLELSYAADVLPAFYDPVIPNHRYASPNKLFEGMMLGRPVLAGRGTSFDRLVDEIVCGLVVDYGEVAQIENALRTLEDPTLRHLMGENGRRAYERTYAWPRMAERLLDLYESLDKRG
jgi:glycosyltransferase involved in cell wall biosynthesis